MRLSLISLLLKPLKFSLVLALYFLLVLLFLIHLLGLLSLILYI